MHGTFYPDLLGSEWQYFIEWYPGGASGSYQRTSAVRLTSGPRPGQDDIEVEVWTDSEASSDLVTGLHPITVYAKVTKGGRPVQEAKATLVILVAGQSGLQEGVLTLDLLDNGNGDPDLVRGDGIYSRYVTRYLTPGRYRFKVEVTDNEGRAFTPSAFMDSNLLNVEAVPDQLIAPCCGSVVHVEEQDREPTGAFDRVGSGPVIHLFQVPDPSVDLMPPGRITDLKVLMLDNGQLVATWTSPGDDYDSGSVSGYRFVVADNISHLLDPNSDKQTLVGFTQPDEAATQTSYQFEVRADDDKYNKDIFVGLVAFDERDNEGKVSNIVTLHLTRDGIYGSDEGAAAGSGVPLTNNVDKGDSSIVIGAVCGVIAVMAALLWVGIWYFRAGPGHKAVKSAGVKKSGVTANLVGETGSSQHNDSNNDIEQQQQHHEVDTNALYTPKFNTLVRNPRNATLIHPVLEQQASVTTASRPAAATEQNQTPIYWSASQLLGEHERNSQTRFNTLPAGGGLASGPLDPISEEFTSDDLFHDTADADAYAQGLANYGYQTQILHRQSTVATSTPLAATSRRSVVPTNNNDVYGGGGSTLMMSDSMVAHTSKLHEPIYVGYGDTKPTYTPRKKSKSAKISTITTTHGQPANNEGDELYAQRNITHV